MLIDLDDIMIYYPKILIYSHCVKSVRIRNYSVNIFPHLDWIRRGTEYTESFSIIYDICFSSDINYNGRLQIKIYFLGSIYHLWFDKDVRQEKIAIIHYL